MPKYLTPGQYLRSSDGMQTAAGLSQEVVATFIQRAESAIDNTIMQFDPLLGGFEPHTVWYQKQWDYASLKTQLPNRPVPIRDVSRYSIQVSNVSQSGAGFFANINKGDIVFHVFDQYIELVPLQSITYSMTPVIIALGLNPPIVQVEYSVGFYVPVFGDTLYDSGDGLTFRAIRGFWANTYAMAAFAQPQTPSAIPPVPPVVYSNGVVVSSANYTVNYTEGQVTFNTSQTGNTITANYTSQIPDLVKAAAIAQTSWIIGQADLNALGMAGIDSAKNNDQMIRRPYTRRSIPGQKFSVSHEALELLAGYQQMAIA
jgi:hypothetical protein